MTPRRVLGRRVLLRDLGRATLGIVVLGVTACGDDDAARGGPAASDADDPAASPRDAPPSNEPSPETTTDEPTTDDSPAGSGAVGTTGWSRVDLGFVSAYVLVRAGEAVVVDTGVRGSEDDIAAVLDAAGSSWTDVAHVVVTHKHDDHVGSVEAVLAAAADATAHAGADDVPFIRASRPVSALRDGDTVAGLTIVATPGHTPGHVSVHDPQGRGVLVAGDALNGTDGTGVAGPNPRFTPDMDAAMASVERLAGLAYDDVLFGHGPPLLGGAAAAVAALVGSS